MYIQKTTLCKEAQSMSKITKEEKKAMNSDMQRACNQLYRTHYFNSNSRTNMRALEVFQNIS